MQQTTSLDVLPLMRPRYARALRLQLELTGEPPAIEARGKRPALWLSKAFDWGDSVRPLQFWTEAYDYLVLREHGDVALVEPTEQFGQMRNLPGFSLETLTLEAQETRYAQPLAEREAPPPFKFKRFGNSGTYMDFIQPVKLTPEVLANDATMQTADSRAVRDMKIADLIARGALTAIPAVYVVVDGPVPQSSDASDRARAAGLINAEELGYHLPQRAFHNVPLAHRVALPPIAASDARHLSADQLAEAAAAGRLEGLNEFFDMDEWPLPR